METALQCITMSVLFLRFLQLWFSQMESLSKADLAVEAIESTGKEEEGRVLESSFKMAKMMMMLMILVTTVTTGRGVLSSSRCTF